MNPADSGLAFASTIILQTKTFLPADLPAQAESSDSACLARVHSSERKERSFINTRGMDFFSAETSSQTAMRVPAKEHLQTSGQWMQPI